MLCAFVYLCLWVYMCVFFFDDPVCRFALGYRYASMKAIVIASICTLLPFCDVPVFWPILLIYFIVLFALTMRRQIEHVRLSKWHVLCCSAVRSSWQHVHCDLYRLAYLLEQMIKYKYIPFSLGKPAYTSGKKNAAASTAVSSSAAAAAVVGGAFRTQSCHLCVGSICSLMFLAAHCIPFVMCLQVPAP